MATNTARVLLIMPLAEQRGGGELMLWQLVRDGRDQGVDWTVVFLREGPMVEQVRGLGLPTHVIPSGKMRDLTRMVSTARRIADLARRERIDLILGWMGTAQLYGGLASLFSGVSAAWYQLGIPLDKPFIDRVATRLPARFILACSKAGAAAQAGMTPARLTHVVYPGADLDRFDTSRLPTPAEARANLGLPPSGPLIGIVGRLQRWKGMHVVIEAMPAIREWHPDAHVVIVGGAHEFEPDYPAFLEKRIDELGLKDAVRMVGLQTNVPEWMQAMDVIIHASDKEPFGIVVIEAMALGKPVVATDTAGPLEIITPGENGLLTPYGDAPALAAAVLRYLDDPALRARVGAAAAVRAHDFTTARYAREIIDHCRAAVQQHGQ